jgi:hypothetical protein
VRDENGEQRRGGETPPALGGRPEGYPVERVLRDPKQEYEREAAVPEEFNGEQREREKDVR